MLSVDRNSIMKTVEGFGQSGSYSLLRDITIEFTKLQLTPNWKSLKIPLSIAMKVTRQLLRILEGNDQSVKHMAWYCFSSLCDRGINHCAFDFMAEISSTNVFRLVPRSISSADKGHHDEATWCLTFLTSFTVSDESRKVIVCEKEGIVDSIMVALNTKYDKLHGRLKCALLSTATNILSGSGDVMKPRTDLLLRNDGFTILHKVTQSTFQWACATIALRPLNEQESDVIQSAVNAITSLYGALIHQLKIEHSGLPKSLYTYGEADFERTTSLMYQLLAFPTCTDDKYKETAIKATSNFWSYAKLFHIFSFESMLLFREAIPFAPGSSGVPYIVLFMRTLHDVRFSHLQDMFDQSITVYGLFPSVKALIDRELSTRVPLDLAAARTLEICAVPGCLQGGNNKIKLMRCGRCKKVGYCGQEHQKEHWPEHKKVCGK